MSSIKEGAVGMCWKLNLGRQLKIEARPLGDWLISDTYLKSPESRVA